MYIVYVGIGNIK